MNLPLVVNFNNSNLLSDTEVIELLKKLPYGHITNPPLQKFEYIDLINIRNPQSRRRFPEQVLGECRITDNGDQASILIYRQKDYGNDMLFDFKLCILHEIGHVVFQCLSESNQIKWYSLYGQRPPPVIWNEAGRDPIEHFCDTYANLIMIPRLVEKRFTKEYRYMQRIVFK